jgi:hypothetical protein
MTNETNRYETVSDFWADGNYATRKYNEDYERRLRIEAERRRDKIKADEEVRNKLASVLARNEFHPNLDHCSSCYGEYIDGYAGGGVMMDGYCCCKDSRIRGIVHPLEDSGYKPRYPPVDGKPPPEFKYYGPRTQERFLARFKDQLK